ncbi:MAG: hypothetical protein AAFR96_12420 [Planctomycetota bacterium]
MLSRAIGVSTGVLALAGNAAAQPNVTFSFASDTASGPAVAQTFRGEAGSGVVEIFRSRVGLLADDANGPLPTLEFDDTLFYADFQLTYDSSTTLGTGQTLHAYRIDGTFRFDAVTTMTVDIVDGLFTSLGGADSWGSTATIQASSTAGSTVTYTWDRESFPEYNLFEGESSQTLTDASFTLSNLLSFTADATQPGVMLDPQTFLPAEKWQSEGSFSGSAFFVPAPASVAVACVGGLIAARRRR